MANQGISEKWDRLQRVVIEISDLASGTEKTRGQHLTPKANIREPGGEVRLLKVNMSRGVHRHQ